MIELRNSQLFNWLFAIVIAMIYESVDEHWNALSTLLEIAKQEKVINYYY